LSLDAKLPLHYKDHKLIGNFKNLRECHIEPDWLLLYFKEDTKVSLVLMRTGSHSDLFEK